MQHIFPACLMTCVLAMWCVSADAQSCSLSFSSPEKNSVFRTEGIKIGAVGNPSVRLSNWDVVGIVQIDIGGMPDDGFLITSEFSPFPVPFPYFDFPDSVRLEEGRNEFRVDGSIYRSEWWPDSLCVAEDRISLFYMKPNDQCYAMVEELDKIPQPPNDPTNGFVINQRCIAKYSCGNRPQMQDPAWLTKVVPAFVQPFLDKSGKWNEVIDECRQQSNVLPRYVRKRSCEKWMANYHIAQDLQRALNTNGCGVLPDWDEVGGYINKCIAEQNNALEAAVANLIVATNQNRV